MSLFHLKRGSFHSPLKSLDVFPTTKELLGTKSYIDKNIPKGSFPSVNDYLKIQFKLLREDFVAPLRKAVLAYRSKKPQDSLSIHKNVVIRTPRPKAGEPHYSVRVELTLKPNEDLQNSKRFMTGSLLIFTNDNFRSFVFATVVKSPQRVVNKTNFVDVGVDFHNDHYLRYDTMAECRSYFAPYFHVLTALKSINPHDFPMEKYIIRAKNSQNFPKYLKPGRVMTIRGCRLDPRATWPEKILHGFNKSQMVAFKAALTQEFTLIQGPPGTGKTYVGLEIAKSLIDNSQLWHKGSPLLVVSQKNHTVDQFLEGLIPHTKRIVRIGNHSESEELKKFTSEASPLHQALVVGMTTCCAAATIQDFDDINFPIVIVDEAAEVLEAHVIAALARNCQQLIMLGDHKQLKPMVNDYKLKKEYHLGISLFERMVNNGVQCQVLDVQYRMSPEIAALLRLKIYPFLMDHESVKSNPGVNGVEKSLFFLHHDKPEEPWGVSKKNKHEAQFLSQFAMYLVLNCYSAENITILASYSGQVQEIRAELKKKQILLGQDVSLVRVTTLDGFQGEESDIILLSLVRNNKDDQLGFLIDENRICVALSRARYGLYLMGNQQLLRSSATWRPIVTHLDRRGAVGTSITLHCTNHKTREEVRSAQDFQKVPHGGCERKCEFTLKCGHDCRFFCHGLDKEHKEYKCKEKCRRASCKLHGCQKFCFEKCRPCIVKVKKEFLCGHKVTTKCYVKECPECEANLEDCLKKVVRFSLA